MTTPSRAGSPRARQHAPAGTPNRATPKRSNGNRRRPRPQGGGPASTAAPAAPVIDRTPVEVPTGPGSFAALDVPHALCEVLARQGLVEAFPIQTSTLPDSLAGRDVLGQGRTGSGKTVAFALPVVARLAATPPRQGDRRPRALILVPTRELAAQVHAVVQPLAAAVGLRSATIFGGVSAAPQLAALRQGVEIIIGCPGRLVDHLQTGALDLRAIEITVLDEADHMADVGFLPMVRRLLDATPQGRQRLLFSATLAGGVDQVVNKYMNDPVSHAVAVEAPIEMTHHVLLTDPDDRLDVVAALARSQRVVVFTRTKHRAKQLARKLAALGLPAVELHGNLSQNARTANLAAFSSGRASALVATDIAARGIHVDQVPLVVHADPPVEHKAYVHRSGRTARAGESGTVVTLSAPDQVKEVRGLLRAASITASWWQLAAGNPDPVAVLDGHGVAFADAAPANAQRPRPSGARPGQPARPGQQRRRQGGNGGFRRS
jgi:superfamily II DNA/RNA helicase